MPKLSDAAEATASRASGRMWAPLRPVRGRGVWYEGLLNGYLRRRRVCKGATRPMYSRCMAQGYASRRASWCQCHTSNECHTSNDEDGGEDLVEHFPEPHLYTALVLIIFCTPQVPSTGHIRDAPRHLVHADDHDSRRQRWPRPRPCLRLAPRKISPSVPHFHRSREAQANQKYIRLGGTEG